MTASQLRICAPDHGASLAAGLLLVPGAGQCRPLCQAVGSVLVAVGILVVDVGEGTDLGPSAVGLEQQRAEGDAGEAHLAPVRAPGVPDPPVVEPALLVRAPAGDGDDVVDGLAGRVGDDAARVVQDVVRVDPARDGPAAVDLLDHGPASAYPAPVGDRGVRVVAEADALAAP